MLGLIDWKKEGAFIGLEYKLQLGGYSLATLLYDKVTHETAPMPLVEFGAICTVGEGGVKVKTLLLDDALAEARTAFQHALSLYRFAESQGNVPKATRYTNPKNASETLVSVTEIIGFVINKWGLMNWNFHQGMETMHALMLHHSYPSVFNLDLAKTMAEQKKLRPIDKRDAAGSIGTTIHRNVAAFLKSDYVDLSQAPPWLKTTMAKFSQWSTRVKLKPVHVEQMVFHPTLLYAGTLDTIVQCEPLTLGGTHESFTESR